MLNNSNSNKLRKDKFNPKWKKVKDKRSSSINNNNIWDSRLIIMIKTALITKIINNLKRVYSNKCLKTAKTMESKT